ncbi:potassium channel family protein [Lutibaculum baratangense]|uniref:Potassium channel domain-containing protein n=1 Tax=Lutibaculum baratangense AMV1 TaxID=631454 RepID=V4R685_9HYPH|nr:potassium channel family protein [Lutibaculum baratangense]ESR27442.1 hypothetical protein N177_0046 [Lutibaculum baratangense AMV1]
MVLLSLLGALLIFATVGDVLVTALTTRGAGPVTSLAGSRLWTLFLWWHRRWTSHNLLAYGGMAILASIATLWILGLWAGWSLVFLGAEVPLVSASDGTPADTLEIVYFAGYTLFTLGLGDFRPDGDTWRILTALCAGNGLLVLTMAVTYFVPIVSAATERRQIALAIDTVGSSPSAILRNCWDGSRFDLEQVASELVSPILHQGQQHLAYPVLHYFHSPQAASALPVRLAAFSEALRIVQERVPQENRPRELPMRRCSLAIASFLQTLESTHIKASAEEPSLPDLEALRREGLPLADEALVEPSRLVLHRERRHLKAFVESDGWTWPDVLGERQG